MLPMPLRIFAQAVIAWETLRLITLRGMVIKIAVLREWTNFSIQRTRTKLRVKELLEL